MLLSELEWDERANSTTYDHAFVRTDRECLFVWRHKTTGLLDIQTIGAIDGKVGLYKDLEPIEAQAVLYHYLNITEPAS